MLEQENFISFVSNFQVRTEFGFDQSVCSGIHYTYESLNANSRNPQKLSDQSNNQKAPVYEGVSGNNTCSNELIPAPINNQIQQPPIGAIAIPIIPEPIDLEELETFAIRFRHKRLEMGFTQSDVGLAIGKLYGFDFSQTTISRFEAMNLSFNNMCKLQPILKRWLEETQIALASGTLEHQLEVMRQHLDEPEIFRKRRRRTPIDSAVRKTLDAAFKECPRPTTEQIAAVGDTLKLDREVVRVWFCNRRQRERRIRSASKLQTVLDGQANGNSNGLLLYAQPAAQQAVVDHSATQQAVVDHSATQQAVVDQSVSNAAESAQFSDVSEDSSLNSYSNL